MRSRILSRFARSGSGDEGFTLTEVMMTLFIISAVLLGLITVQVKALGSVGLAKERQQATALANRTMEQLRALPYDTVTAGLRSCDITGDTNITSGAFRPAYDSSINEPLVTNSTACSGAAQAPLYPHVQNGAATLVGSTQFRVRTYVSRVHATQDQGYFLTVLVNWSSANSSFKNKVSAVRSRVFSPTGCSSTSTATRPFAGPCQAFFYSDAGTAPSGITVAAIADGAPLLTGVDVTRMEAKLPAMSARTQNEQIVSAQSIATASKLLLTTTSESSAGGQSAASAADTDPATGAGNSPAGASSLSASGSTTLSTSGSTAAFSVSRPSSTSGSSYSTTQATSTPACQDDAGTGLVTNQACSSANVTPSGSWRARMDLNLPGGGIKSADLARIDTPATPTAWRSYGARAALPVSGHCTSTSGIGCVASGARRTLGSVTAGSLPPIGSGDAMTTGFTGSMVTLTGFGATAASESGISPAAGSASRAANVLTYWNGTSYSVVTLGGSGASYSLGTAVGAYRVAGYPDVTVTMTGTVLVDPVTTVSTGAAPCQTSACTSTSTVGGVRIAIRYDVANGTTALGSFMVTTDLGTTIAQTTYKAAPSA